MPGDWFIELAKTQDFHVFDVLFRHAKEAVTVQDRSGRVIYANDQAAALVGLSAGQEMVSVPATDFANRFRIVDESGAAIDPSVLPGRRVLEGEEAHEITVGYLVEGSSKARWSRVNASPIKNDAGDVVWAVNFFLDVTDQYRRREREAFLARVTEALSAGLTADPKLKSLADVLVPDLAGWCGFHLLDEFGNLEAVGVAFPQTPDARSLFDIAETGTVNSSVDTMQTRVLASRHAEYIPAVTDEMLDAVEETVGKDLADLLRRLELGSVLCIPLGAGGIEVGTMTLMRTRREGPFDEDDLALIEQVAQRAGVVLANSRIFEREHQIAEALRRGLTPESVPDVPWLRIAARYLPLVRPGYVGGDFYDVIVLDDDTCALLMGDIEGKGVEAAAAVGMARQTLKTTIALRPDPVTVLGRLNVALREGGYSRMCTLAYVVLERQDDRVLAWISLAGHPPVVVLRGDGTMELVGDPCPPLGPFPEVEPLTVSVDLRPGDALVAYTDGFETSEQSPPEMVSMILKRCSADAPDRLLDEMLGVFRDIAPHPSDDLALLAARVT